MTKTGVKDENFGQNYDCFLYSSHRLCTSCLALSARLAVYVHQDWRYGLVVDLFADAK